MYATGTQKLTKQSTCDRIAKSNNIQLKYSYVVQSSKTRVSLIPKYNHHLHPTHQYFAIIP